VVSHHGFPRQAEGEIDTQHERSTVATV
jgi:hypothetical protein